MKKNVSQGKLNEFQDKCMHLLKEKENCLICAPSSSGKTFLTKEYIKEYIIDNYSFFLRSPKKIKIVLLFPYKSIAIQEFNSLIEFSERKKVKLFLAVGGVKVDKEVLLEANIIVGTYEKFFFLLNLFPELTSNLKIVAIDEFHFLGSNRGKIIESILLTIRKNKNTQIILLSSSIGNPEEIAEWLDFKYLKFNQRVIPLECKVKKIERSLPVEILSLEKENLPILIFRSSRSKVEQLAYELAKKRKDIIINKKLKDFFNINSSELSTILTETFFPEKLLYVLSKRVGYHHAGLSDIVRIFVEQAFLAGEIDYLICTSTLAAGMNLPAKMSILIAENRTKDVDNNLIFQILGRAGRFALQDKGIGVVLVKFNEEKRYQTALFDNHQQPIYSPIESKFVDYDFLVSYFLVEIVFSKSPYSVKIENLLDTIERSFWFYKNKESFRQFNSKTVHYALFSQKYTYLDFKEILDYYELFDSSDEVNKGQIRLLSKEEKSNGDCAFIVEENKLKFKVLMGLNNRSCSCQSPYSNFICKHQRFIIRSFPHMKEYWLSHFGIIDWLVQYGFLVRSKDMKVNPTEMGRLAARYFVHPYSFLYYLNYVQKTPEVSFKKFLTKVVFYDQQLQNEIKANELTNLQALQIFQLIGKKSNLEICSKYFVSDSLIEDWVELLEKYRSFYFDLLKLVGKTKSLEQVISTKIKPKLKENH